MDQEDCRIADPRSQVLALSLPPRIHSQRPLRVPANPEQRYGGGFEGRSREERHRLWVSRRFFLPFVRVHRDRRPPSFLSVRSRSSQLTSLSHSRRHYDSRGSFGSTRAPGADDDGSGTVQLLGIARALGRAGVKGFKEKVTIAFFAGEEQGLLGSRAFASKSHWGEKEERANSRNRLLIVHSVPFSFFLHFQRNSTKPTLPFSSKSKPTCWPTTILSSPCSSVSLICEVVSRLPSRFLFPPRF